MLVALIPRLILSTTYRYYYMSPPFAISELDGLRVVDTQQCDFIQLVPSSSSKVFRPGSTDPAAILFDAYEHYEKKSAKADENISSIKPDLAGAVDTLIEAAGQEIEPYWQRRLLHVSGGLFHGPGDSYANVALKGCSIRSSIP